MKTVKDMFKEWCATGVPLDYLEKYNRPYTRSEDAILWQYALMAFEAGYKACQEEQKSSK